MLQDGAESHSRGHCLSSALPLLCLLDGRLNGCFQLADFVLSVSCAQAQGKGVHGRNESCLTSTAIATAIHRRRRMTRRARVPSRDVFTRSSPLPRSRHVGGLPEAGASNANRVAGPLNTVSSPSSPVTCRTRKRGGSAAVSGRQILGLPLLPLVLRKAHDWRTRGASGSVTTGLGSAAAAVGSSSPSPSSPSPPSSSSLASSRAFPTPKACAPNTPGPPSACGASTAARRFTRHTRAGVNTEARGAERVEHGQASKAAHLPTWRSRQSRRTSAARTRTLRSLRPRRRRQSPGRRRRSRRSPPGRALCLLLGPRPCPPRHPPPSASVQQPGQQQQAAGRQSWRSAGGVQFGFCGAVALRMMLAISSHHTQAECVSSS